MHKIQKEILKLLNKKAQPYSELYKFLKIRSNLFDYHLQKLLQQNLIRKSKNNSNSLLASRLTGEFEGWKNQGCGLKRGVKPRFFHKYDLSTLGQSISPYLEFERQPILAVVLAIFKNNKVVLIKREKHAFKGYWALPGGKIKFGETIEQAAERICREETGLELQSAKYLATIQELVREKACNKYHFILLLYKIKAKGILKNGKLFSLNNLPKKIVPSDAHMLKLTRAKLATSIINENKNKLVQKVFD